MENIDKNLAEIIVIAYILFCGIILRAIMETIASLIEFIRKKRAWKNGDTYFVGRRGIEANIGNIFKSEKFKKQLLEIDKIKLKE